MSYQPEQYDQLWKRLKGFGEVRAIGWGLKETCDQLLPVETYRVYVLQKRSLSRVSRNKRIPPDMDGVNIDVIQYHPIFSCGTQKGLHIANQRGIPGTLGCQAYARTNSEKVFLTSQHVLFGSGTIINDPVWWVRETKAGIRKVLLGKAKSGKIGRVAFEGKSYHIDCATIGEINPEVSPTINHYTGTNRAVPGMRVSKTGYTTGMTYGMITDTQYTERATVNEVSFIMENQIVIRPKNPNETAPAFCQKGDSGAVIADKGNRVTGLLWGSNDKGEGIASHIKPVLSEMDIRIEPLNN